MATAGLSQHQRKGKRGHGSRTAGPRHQRVFSSSSSWVLAKGTGGSWRSTWGTLQEEQGLKGFVLRFASCWALAPHLLCGNTLAQREQPAGSGRAGGQSLLLSPVQVPQGFVPTWSLCHTIPQLSVSGDAKKETTRSRTCLGLLPWGRVCSLPGLRDLEPAVGRAGRESQTEGGDLLKYL